MEEDMRGVTKTVRGEQTPKLPGLFHRIMKRNASQDDLAWLALRKGNMVYETIGADIDGTAEVRRLYIIIDAYLDDLKRLVAILAEAGATTTDNQGVKEDDNTNNPFGESAT